jgi:hypothetical protein
MLAYSGGTEVVAMALLTGAACGQLSARSAAAVVVASVIARVAAPLLRYGIGSRRRCWPCRPHCCGASRWPSG